MPQSKQKPVKPIDISHSGKGYRVFSKASVNHSTAHYFQKVGIVVNFPGSGQPTIQKVTEEPKTTCKGLTSLGKGQCSRVKNKKEAEQKQHLWKSSKEKTTADQNEHKRLILHLPMPSRSPRALGKIFCGLMRQR